MRTIASLRADFRVFHFVRVSFLLFLSGALAGVFGVTNVHAQAEGPSLRSTQRPVRVALDPTYQYYETAEGRLLTQISSQLSVFVPIGQRFSMRANAGYARMDAGIDSIGHVQGPTDVSVSASYAQPVGEGSIVFQVRANAPTGKQSLSAGELAVTRPISQDFYDFRVSSFSRGLSVSPQVTWAFPITDRLAVGIGGGYQHQRGFQPNAGLTPDSLYVPGDGVGGNAGVDYKITNSSALGLDVSFRRYGTDEVGGSPRFDAGNRIAGTLRYLVRSGFTTIRAVARYTNWEKSRFGFRLGSPKREQVLPPHGMVLGSYRTRLTEGIRLQVRASGHWYGKTVGEERKIFGRAYVSPSFKLADVLAVEPHGTVTYGSYLGVGGGLRIVGSF